MSGLGGRIMTPLRVLLVDDEGLARLRMRALLGELTDPAVEVVGEAEDGEQAHAIVRAGGVDLVLLDIGLPGRSGLRWAERWRARPQPPAVVFVTAHAEHALQAFELAATDYLTKPVRRERLQDALRRVAAQRGSAAAPAAAAGIESGGPDVPEDGAAPAPALVVGERGRVLRVPLHEVLYLKAELKYVTLRTAAHSHVLDEPLAGLERRLGAAFVRVHRNALVARSAMRELQLRPTSDRDDEDAAGEAWAVRVAPTDEWLAVSRRQLAAVREALRGQGPGT